MVGTFPHPWRILVLALVSVAFMAMPAAAAACANADIVPSPGNLGDVKAATMCLVNEERAQRGLRRLGGDNKLARAALRHSKDMVARRYFDHRSPNGATMVHRAKKVRYFASASRWQLAENLAWGTGTLGSPRAIVVAWMNSAAHRDNILNGALREAGLGVAPGTPRSGGDGATFTMLFGTVR